MTANAPDRTLAALADLPDEAQIVLRQLDALLDHLPDESVDEIERRMTTVREQVVGLGAELQRQKIAAVLALQIGMELRAQRDRHAANYHALVYALETGDQTHAKVEAFVETFMAVDTDGILGNLEQVLRDPDAASTLVDWAMGDEDIAPDDLDHVIASLQALRERQAG